MIKYKINVLKALAGVGWSQSRLKKYGLLSGATLDRFRAGLPVGFDALGTVCALLDCQPGDVIESALTMEEQTTLFNLRHEKRDKDV